MSAVIEVTLTRLDYLAHGGPFLARDQTISVAGRWRRVDFVEILLVTGGTAQLVCFHPGGGRTVRRLAPGRMMLFRPTDDTEISDLGPSGLSVRFVAFPVEEWRAFATLAGLDPGWATAPDPLEAAVDPDDAAIAQPFDRAVDRYRADAAPHDLLRFWMDVASRVVPFRPALARGAGAPDWLARSIEAMREEANLRAGVPRLRGLAHVSASYLATAMRRHYDLTPTALVTEFRVRHAARLLATTSESTGRIALRCGFSSLTYFGRCFRASYRMSARQYRLRARRASYGGPVRGPAGATSAVASSGSPAWPASSEEAGRSAHPVR